MSEEITTDKTDQVTSEYSRLARTQRLLASSGIIAPIFFTSLVIVLGLLEPGYDHRTEMMSILGGARGVRGAVFNGGTMVGSR